MFGFFKKKHKTSLAVPPTYRAFLTMFPLCSKEMQAEYIDILSKQTRPDYFCGREVPQNLNGLTYGQLDDLRSASEEKNDYAIACAITKAVFGTELNFFNEDVNKVYGFVNFCTKELKRINEIFGSLKPDYSPEEIQAGANKLDFGSFGILDWYAKRMGITNQNEVRNVAWVRIFQCMKNDHMVQMYERRLQNVYLKKSKSSAK